jgi:hypothetical protein
MKRIMAVLAFVVVAASGAFAEGFMGIEWGTDSETTLRTMMIEKGFKRIGELVPCTYGNMDFARISFSGRFSGEDVEISIYIENDGKTGSLQIGTIEYKGREWGRVYNGYFHSLTNKYGNSSGLRNFAWTTKDTVIILPMMTPRIEYWSRDISLRYVAWKEAHDKDDF